MDSCFDKIRQNNCTLYIHKNFRNDNLEQALLTGEKELQQRYRLTPVRSSGFARVHKFAVRFDSVERGIYFKQYFCRSGWDFIKHLVRASRAKRAFKASEVLTENGFETPVIIAMGECKSGFFNTRNFLVTLEVESAKQIHQLIPGSLENLTKEQLQGKRKLVRAFGQTVGRMHRAGIFHGDLRLGNVLARQEKSSWHFFFIDNERTRQFRRLPARLRLKNMVQINMFRDGITNTDRLRFFKTYIEKNPTVKINSNAWVTKVLSKTCLRLQKEQN